MPAAKEKFYSLMEQMPMGVLILRGPGHMIEMVNSMYLQLVDRTEAQMIGRELLQAMPELAGQGIRELLDSVLHTGVPYEGHEFRADLLRHGHLEPAYFTFVYHPLREDDGAVSSIAVVVTEVSAIVRARRALTQSEEQFRSLVTQSSVAMGIFRGADMVIELANDALLQIWKRRSEEVIGVKLLVAFPELLDQQYPAVLDQVYRSGMPYEEKESIAYVDSPGGMTRYYLNVVYAPLTEADGTTGGIMVNAVDVTAQVEAREGLIEAETRSRLAIEASNQGTFDWDLATGSFIFSDRLAAMFGYPDPQGVTHEDLITRFHPDDKPIRDRANSEALGTGTLTYELRLLWPDGSLHWLQTHGKIIYDSAKTPLRMHGICADITDRVLAVQQVARNEERFRLLADFMPQQIWTSDAQGSLNYFNRAVYDYSGFSHADINDRGWISIVHPDDRDENIRQWIEAVTTGGTFIFEHRFRKHDGEYRWQLSRALPQRDATGAIQMWIGTSTDIHDRKVMSDELERHVEARTQELKQANEDLLRTNLELEQFAFIASHDLQEPLRKIRTFANMLLEKGTSYEGSQEYVRKIHLSAERMSSLIRDVLDYSRIVRTDDAYGPVDLHEIFDNVVADYELLIAQKKAVVTATPLPTIYGVALQFNQLFSNLIGNALKFADKDPLITVSAGMATPQELLSLGEMNPTARYTKLTFSDNGIGFEQQYADKIFTIFQRLNDRAKYAGTGIGLAMCRKIVDNHHGFITAHSEPGHGATFTVYLLAKSMEN